MSVTVLNPFAKQIASYHPQGAELLNKAAEAEARGDYKAATAFISQITTHFLNR